ncbi:DNA-binding protein [Rhizobium jaguaris]|uniref:DNA-binding protein n=2 Tax=Rhizobium jaguaris TaxID=1312183 RepID=A0A387FW91_9HYPH|nr:DNA-binding protein [Rhizobium jaguaris]
MLLQFGDMIFELRAVDVESSERRDELVRRQRSMAGLLDRLGVSVRGSYEVDRRNNPHRFTGSSDGLGGDFLFVENVARMLGCGVDFVRRIPRSELPASKIGARLIYRRSDVVVFITSRRDQGGGARVVPARKMRTPVAREPVQLVAPEKAGSFDPVSYVRTLTKGENQRDDKGKARG